MLILPDVMSIHTFFRPSLGRSAKHTQNHNTTRKIPSLWEENRHDNQILTSGEEYYPHTVYG